MFNLPGQDLSIIHCPCNRYSSPNPSQPTIRDLRAAVGGDGDRVAHLKTVCIWWKEFIQYKNQLIYTWSGLFCNACHRYKGVISAGRISLLLMWKPTRTWCRQVSTSHSWSLVSLELTGLKTPGRLFPTVLWSAPRTNPVMETWKCDCKK